MVGAAAERDADLIERLYHALEPMVKGYFRPVVRGFDRIPSGAGLFVGNHNGGVLMPETFVFCVELYRHLGLDGMPFPLAHDRLIGLPFIKELLHRLGGMPASPENAHGILSGGGKVLVYPGGDQDCLRPYRERNRIIFGERRGYIRLALREGVPIIPVVAAGAHETFYVLNDGHRLARLLWLDRLARIDVLPITFCLPWGITPGPYGPYLPLPTKIYLEVLDPIYFERQGNDAAQDLAYVEECHRRVHGTMEESLQRLADEREQEMADRSAAGRMVTRRLKSAFDLPSQGGESSDVMWAVSLLSRLFLN